MSGLDELIEQLKRQAAEQGIEASGLTPVPDELLHSLSRRSDCTEQVEALREEMTEMLEALQTSWDEQWLCQKKAHEELAKQVAAIPASSAEAVLKHLHAREMAERDAEHSKVQVEASLESERLKLRRYFVDRFFDTIVEFLKAAVDVAKKAAESNIFMGLLGIALIFGTVGVCVGGSGVVEWGSLRASASKNADAANREAEAGEETTHDVGRVDEDLPRTSYHPPVP